MNRSITGGIARPLGSSEVLELRVQDAQLVVIQSDLKDSYISYSREGLDHDSSRMKLSQFQAVDGSGDSAIVLTFPLKPYTGTFFFASTDNTQNANISLLQVGCGSRNKGY